MHLGNGIICPVTGIPMLAIAAGTAFYAFKKFKNQNSNNNIFLITTLTILCFALQMINFAIPLTGSSGHIIGGILLSALIGPYAAFLAMCSILIVQSVFFADGGLLALGCNIFNMGFLACFVAYPFIYKLLAKRNKPMLAAVISSIAALQLGSIAVVLEAFLSNSIQSSAILSFTGLMQAIHLPIGIVEGVITGGIVSLSKVISEKKLSSSFAISSIILASVIAQYASTKPDGLEWSLLNISDYVVAQTQWSLYSISEAVQSKLAFLQSFPNAIANLCGVIILGLMIFGIFKILTLKNKVTE